MSRIEKKKLFIELAIMAMIILAFIIVNIKINESRFTEDSRDSYSLDYVFQLDKVEFSADEITVDGWCFRMGEDTTENGTSPELILVNVQTKKTRRYSTDIVVRDDVNRYFDCEFNYSNCGFCTHMNKNALNLDENTYEVFLHYKGESYGIQTDVFLSKDGVSYTNPQKFRRIESSNVDLIELTENGILRFYIPDKDVYVYQYDDFLFWILGPSYEYSCDITEKMQYQTWTTQGTLLPITEYRKDNFADNFQFSLQDYWCENLSGDGYNVYQRELPNTYAIARILTGDYSDSEKWVWTRCFRPYYQIE